MSVIHEKLFYIFYNTLGPASPISGVTIFFAQWFPYILVAGALVYELFVRNDGKDTLRALMRIYTPPGIVLTLTEIFKQFVPYPRPFAALEIPSSIFVSAPFGSFPSSHTAFFAALGVTMYFCTHKLGKVFLWSALLIGIARVGTGVHWPIDILGGFFVGALLGFVIEKISLIVWKKSVPEC